jgi:hypothetical protein
MHDDAGGLVDDDERIVLVGNRELDLFVLDGSRAGGSVELDLLPTLEPPRLRARDAVDERARLDRALRRRARADVRRDESVEARSCRVLRNPNAQGDPPPAARTARSRRRPR